MLPLCIGNAGLPLIDDHGRWPRPFSNDGDISMIRKLLSFTALALAVGLTRLACFAARGWLW